MDYQHKQDKEDVGDGDDERGYKEAIVRPVVNVPVWIYPINQKAVDEAQ